MDRLPQRHEQTARREPHADGRLDGARTVRGPVGLVAVELLANLGRLAVDGVDVALMLLLPGADRSDVAVHLSKDVADVIFLAHGPSYGAYSLTTKALWT